MKIKYILFTIAIFIISCSTPKEIVQNKEQFPKFAEHESLTSHQKFDKALKEFIEGNLYEISGNIKTAIEKYKKALEFDSSAGIYYSIGKGYRYLDDLSNALIYAREAYKQEPTNSEYGYLLASVYKLSPTKTDSAEIIYSDLLKYDSLNIKAMYNLADLIETKKPTKALNLYKKITEISGPEWQVMVRIAELNERLGNEKETVSSLEELIELNPSNLDLQKLLIRSYLQIEDFQKAMEKSDDLLSIFPNDTELIELKGNIFFDTGKKDSAYIFYNRLIEEENYSFNSKKMLITFFYQNALNDSSLIYYVRNLITNVRKDSTDWQLEAYMGELEIREFRDSLAIEYFKKATELAAWNSALWNRLGGLLFETERIDEAIDEMEKAVKRFPDEYFINLILGLSLSQKEMPERAIVPLKKTVELNPNQSIPNFAYGFTLNQLGLKDSALTFLEKASQLDPGNPQILGAIGSIYNEIRNYEKSDSIYILAMSLDEESVLIKNNYAYSLAERGIKLEYAKELSEYTLEKEPDNASYLDTYGWILFKMGDFNKALEYILNAYQKDTDNKEILEHLGDVYFKLENKEKAIEYWNMILEIEKDNEKIKEKIKGGLNEI